MMVSRRNDKNFWEQVNPDEDNDALDAFQTGINRICATLNKVLCHVYSSETKK
jgi:hypothetical protein